MKSIFQIILLVIAFCQLHAQTFEYEYDNSGNRISRHIIYLRTANGGGTANVNAQNTDPFIEEQNSDGTTMEIGATKISLFPNPTTKVVTVQYSDTDVETEEVRILNNRGQVVYRDENILGNFELPFERLSSGPYIIWLKLNGNIERFQVIKQ